MTRKIIHFDMDYFFAQIEELKKPELANKPFAVGTNNHRKGVISTCNYIAREYGIHSAMPNVIALAKCPNLIIVDTDMRSYKKVSLIIRDIFHSFTDKVEPLSLDEAFLDVTNVSKYHNSATLIAKAIKDEIFSKTGLTGSAGIAPNKLLAKIASDINKPNGLYTINPNDINDFISKLPVKKLFGVGKVNQEKLKNIDIEFCHQLQKISLEHLINIFGKFGNNLYDNCRGIDQREVNANRIRKSISVENTYESNIKTLDECLLNLPNLYNQLIMRITTEYTNRVSGLIIKITDINFNKTSIVKKCNNIEIDNFKYLLTQLYQKQKHPIRLLGIGVKLDDNNKTQLELF